MFVWSYSIYDSEELRYLVQIAANWCWYLNISMSCVSQLLTVMVNGSNQEIRLETTTRCCCIWMRLSLLHHISYFVLHLHIPVFPWGGSHFSLHTQPKAVFICLKYSAQILQLVLRLVRYNCFPAAAKFKYNKIPFESRIKHKSLQQSFSSEQHSAILSF